MKILNRPLKLWHLVAVLGLLGAVAVAGTTVAARNGNNDGPFLSPTYLKVPAKTIATGTSACPKGANPTGGGAAYFTPSAAEVLDTRQSTPWDSSDAGQAPEDGWLASVQNEGATDALVTVIAVCE